MPETTVARVKSERMRTLACSTFALLFLGLIYAFSMFAAPMGEAFELEKGAIGLTFNIMNKYVEEVGSMNMFFKIDGEVITPPLAGSILPGITRDSIIQQIGRASCRERV